MANRERRGSGKILFINARSCGTIQQLDLLDRYMMEQDVEYAAISDPRLTATSPMGSKHYELVADEKSRYYVCFAVRRGTEETHTRRISPELTPIAERAVAMFIPGYRLHLLVIYGMPVTKTHSDEDRRASWAELHTKIFEQMRDGTDPILMGGDLNAHINAQSLRDGGHPERGKCITKTTDGNGRATLELCKALQLTLMNYDQDAPKGDYTTFMGNAAIKSSTVDYVCVSEGSRQNIDRLTLTAGRPPHNAKTDHRGVLVKWRLENVKRMRVEWKARLCPFTEQGKALAETAEAKYDDLVELIGAQKRSTEGARKKERKTTVEKPSMQMQLLLDRRMKLIQIGDEKVRETQLNGMDREIEVLSAKEEKAKWDEVENEIEKECQAGRGSNILGVIEKHFGAPKRKLYVSKRTKDLLLTHMKSVVSPVGEETGTNTTKMRQHVDVGMENWMVEDNSEPTVVFTDTAYGVEGARHPLTWAVVTGGDRLHCGPVPFGTFGAQIPTVRNGEDWAILEALARVQKPIRVVTDSMHSVKEFKNWGQLVRSEFLKTDGGDAQILRTAHALMRGRTTEVVYGQGHTVGTLNYMAHVGARYAAVRGKENCVLKLPEGMTWERVCAQFRTEKEIWAYMDKWDINLTESTQLNQLRVQPQRMSDEPPTREETIGSMEEIPEKVARGFDEISRGNFKDQEELVSALHELILCIWVGKSLPQTLRRCVMVCVPKDKSAPLGPANCRGLSLLSFVIKVLNNIIRRRLQKLPLSDTQIGFVPGHNVQQGIQVLKALVEAIRNGDAGAVLIFVDLHKAFDCVSRLNLGELLFDSGFSRTAAELLIQLWEHEIVLRFPNGDYSEAFHPTQGTMQGLGLSPIIFTLVMEAVMRQTHTKGVQFFSKRTGRLHCFKNMAYADDLVVVCTDAASAGAFLDSLAMNLKKFGLSINTTKTKVMNVIPKTKPSVMMPVAQAVAKAIDNGNHVSQHPDADTCGVEVRMSIASFFGKGQGMETLVILTPRDADQLVCPNPRCGVVFTALNKSTGRQYSTKMQTRLMHHMQEQHLIERIEMETVVKVTATQRLRSEKYAWKLAPLYRAELAEKMAIVDNRICVYHKGCRLEEVQVQKYLGALIDSAGGMEPEINARVVACNKAFYRIPRGLWTSGVSRKQKAAVYKSIVLGVALFGAEAWVITDEQKYKMEKLITEQLRTVMGMHAELIPEIWDSTRHDHRMPRGEKVWRAAGIPRLGLLLVRARLRLAGQWIRMHTDNELMHLAHVTTLQGEQGTWWAQVVRDTEEVGMKLRSAKNKVEWEKELKLLGRAKKEKTETEENDTEGEDEPEVPEEMVNEDMEDDPDDMEEEGEEAEGEGHHLWDDEGGK